MNKCRELHAIAFLQWRLKKPSPYRFDKDEIEELLMSRINNLLNSFEVNKKITDATLENSKLARDFLVKYKMVDTHERVFLINSFWSLGWPDPYPDDEDLLIGSVDDVPSDFRLPQKPSDDVYAPTRYIS